MPDTRPPSGEVEASAARGDDLARGLDTNVLVRYLLADDEAQHAAATALIEGELTPEAPGLVHPVALCELVWVLRQVYKVPKPDVVAALRLVLAVRTLHVLDEAPVRAALDLFERAGTDGGPAADFADALLSVQYQAEGSALATFDRAASRLPHAHRLGSVASGARGDD